jgi:hypothetical protein
VNNFSLCFWLDSSINKYIYIYIILFIYLFFRGWESNSSNMSFLIFIYLFLEYCSLSQLTQNLSWTIWLGSLSLWNSSGEWSTKVCYFHCLVIDTHLTGSNSGLFICLFRFSSLNGFIHGTCRYYFAIIFFSFLLYPISCLCWYKSFFMLRRL